MAVWPIIQFGAGIGQLASALAGVSCMSYASVYQKRFAAAGDPWTRTALMFIGARVPAAGGAALFELGQLIWTPLMIAIYVWSVLALAVAATMALLFLIERGQASRGFLNLPCPADFRAYRLRRLWRGGHGSAGFGFCHRRCGRGAGAVWS